MPATMNQIVNGLDTQALTDTIKEIRKDPAKGMTKWNAKTKWTGAMSSTTDINGWELGGEHLPQKFSIKIDEPQELLGAGAQPNPQQFLLAATNACMLNTFVATCAMQGVNLDSVVFECEGDIDLRGFLGIDSKVPAGYTELRFAIRVKGDGTREQYEKAHQAMIATSPNYFNMSRSIAMKSKVVVE